MAWHDNFEGFEDLYDAKLRTEDGMEFPIHKVLLAMRSEYISELLCNLDPDERDILVPGIQGSTMRIIIEYVYTSKLSSSEKNICDILEAAYLLGIDKLIQKCRILAVQSLTTRNCIQMYFTAHRIEKLGISEDVSRFIEMNFENIARDTESSFQDLPLEFIENFLVLDNLNVSSERKVWDAIVYWIRKDPKERKLCMKNLIPCVRLSKMDDELAQEILAHPFVTENSDCEELVKIVNSLESAPKHRIPEKMLLLTKFFISTSDYSEGVKIYLTYDQYIDFWREVSSKMFRPKVVLHVTGSLIMMFDTINNIIFSFNVSTMTWLPVHPPSISCKEYNVVKIRDHIYVLGDRWPDDDTDDDTEEDNDEENEDDNTPVERYNIHLGVWETITHIPALSQVFAIVIENNICIIGTLSLFCSEIFAAYLYNPDTDIWRPMQPPKVYRNHFALIAFEEQIWAIGGHNSDEFLKSVEVYNAKEDKWSQFEELPFPFYFPKAVTVNGDLYVYDNHYGKVHEFRGPPVRWDDSSSKWQVVEPSSPFRDLHLYQLCAVEDPEGILGMRRENRDPCTIWEKSPFYIPKCLSDEE